MQEDERRPALHWPRAAARLAALPKLRRPPIRPGRFGWRRRETVRDAQAPLGRLDDPQRSWLFVIGGFAALASLLVFWVGMTVVRSLVEPIPAKVDREVVVAQPARTIIRPTQVSIVAPLLPRIGQVAESAGIRLTVSTVTKRSTHAGAAAVVGRTFLVVDLVLESRRPPVTPYVPAGFRVRDADGGQYVGLIPSADDRRSLKGGGLVNGIPVPGTVAFDVPAGADGFVLDFQPDHLVANFELIRVALGD